ncbi:hypothetical protein BCR35DRAFT_27697 [Leucosporidium creatinivorum]|uniref:Uncharacterized protein n=1 Tax=Leucosporidium creatinivorum TaxID=106004 RepID=A0A1Y2CKM8_9BASI|nr:hypothetical protein BCR35DRAFT_27697 [Leucosporidium creatinivorum]
MSCPHRSRHCHRRGWWDPFVELADDQASSSCRLPPPDRARRRAESSCGPSSHPYHPPASSRRLHQRGKRGQDLVAIQSDSPSRTLRRTSAARLTGIGRIRSPIRRFLMLNMLFARILRVRSRTTTFLAPTLGRRASLSSRPNTSSTSHQDPGTTPRWNRSRPTFTSVPSTSISSARSSCFANRVITSHPSSSTPLSLILPTCRKALPPFSTSSGSRSSHPKSCSNTDGWICSTDKQGTRCLLRVTSAGRSKLSLVSTRAGR